MGDGGWMILCFLLFVESGRALCRYLGFFYCLHSILIILSHSLPSIFGFRFFYWSLIYLQYTLFILLVSAIERASFWVSAPFGGPNQISPMHLFSSVNFRLFTLSFLVTYFIFILWTSALLRTHFPRLGLVCLGYHVNSLPIRLPETKPKWFDRTQYGADGMG